MVLIELARRYQLAAVVAWSIAAAVTVALASRPAMGATDVVVAMEFVAWSKANKLFALKVTDPMRGMAYSVRELKTGKEIDFISIQPGEEKKVWKKVERKHQLVDALHVDQASESGELTLMGKAAPGAVDIMVMAEGMVGLLQRIDLPKDENKGTLAKGTLKSVAWADKDKWILVIVNHKLESELGEDKDTVHTVKYRRWKVDWK